MAAAPQPVRRGNRPRSVTLTAWGVFLFGVANGWRAVGLGRQSSLLISLGVKPDPRLRLVVSVVWAAVFVAVAFALWRRHSFVRLAIPGMLLVYAFYQLVTLLLFAQAAESRSGWPALATQYTVVVLFASWALNRPASRPYFSLGSS